MDLSEIYSIPRTLTIYVDNQRTDLFTPDGSMSRPYKTLKTAMDSITDATSTKRYAIVVHNGFYEEDNPITIKAYSYVQGDFKHNPRIIPKDQNQPLFIYEGTPADPKWTTHDFGELTFVAPEHAAIISATGEGQHAIGGFYYCLFIAPDNAGAGCEAFHHEATLGGYHLVNSFAFSNYWAGGKFETFANIIKGNYRDTGMRIAFGTIIDTYLNQGEGHSEIDLMLVDTDAVGIMYYVDHSDARLVVSTQTTSNPGDCSSSAIYIEKGTVRIRNSDLWGKCYVGKESNVSIQTSEFLNNSYIEGYKPTEIIVTQCKNIKKSPLSGCKCYCANVFGENTRIHFTGNSFVSPAGCEPVQMDGTFVSIEAQGVSQNDVATLAPGASETFEHLPDLSYARVCQVSRYNSAVNNSLDFDTIDKANYYQEDDTKTDFMDDKVQLKGLEFNSYAHYHLNESSGTNVEDSSVNNRDGTTVNMEDSDWVSGKLNNCLQFDGTNEYINLGDIANFERTDPFSLEMWFKTSGTDWTILIAREETSSHYGWLLGMSDTGYIFIRLASTWSHRLQVGTINTFNDDTWHHLVVTYDGSSLTSGITFYVDNIIEGKNIVSDTLSGSMSNTVACRIATTDTGSYNYAGLLDEIVIYNKELSADEVAFRWNSGNGTEESGDFDTTKGWYARTDSNQIDTSSWQNIGQIQITQETPTGTDIRYLFSVEGHGGGTNWKKWDGAQWIIVNLADIDTLGHTKLEVESLTDSQWGALFVGGAGSTLDILASLKSVDPAKTPKLDLIDIVYLVSNRRLCYDQDLKIEFIDATHTKITNTIVPSETLYGLKVNIFMLTPF